MRRRAMQRPQGTNSEMPMNSYEKDCKDASRCSRSAHDVYACGTGDGDGRPVAGTICAIAVAGSGESWISGRTHEIGNCSAMDSGMQEDRHAIHTLIHIRPCFSHTLSSCKILTLEATSFSLGLTNKDEWNSYPSPLPIALLIIAL